MRASLLYYWRTHLAVFAGTAVAVAVLTGALGVGDSVRLSLKSWNLERLGRAQTMVSRDRFFREGLSQEVAEALGSAGSETPVIGLVALRGSAVTPRQKTRVGELHIFGISADFPRRAFADDVWIDPAEIARALTDEPSSVFPPVIINQTVQRALGCAKGDHVILQMARPSRIHRDSLFGEKSSESLIAKLRCRVAAVLPDRGMGRFSLQPAQAAEPVVFVPRDRLQSGLGVEGKINTMLALGNGKQAASPHQLQTALNHVMRMEDAGLTLQTHGEDGILSSQDWSLAPDLVASAQRVAEGLGLTSAPVFTYLANTITHGDRVMPYSAITALDPQRPIFALTLQNGRAAPALKAGEMLLNQWAADDLDAAAGDQVTLEYFVVDAADRLVTDRRTFTVRDVVAMSGAGSDAALSPVIPGIHDADDMGSWRPPFPMDFSLIRPKDEVYWDDHKGAPKAFVSLAQGQELWRSRFGIATAIWLAPPPQTPMNQWQAQFSQAFVQALQPEAVGYRFADLVGDSQSAAHGNTDFGMLFIGFSMFIIAAASMLAAMLFKLGVEQRAFEPGLLGAVGFSRRRIFTRFVGEGTVLVATGGLAGLAAAWGYLNAMVYGLNHWWDLGLSASVLQAHMLPRTWILGYAAGAVITLGSLSWTLRHLVGLPPLKLLQGQLTRESGPQGGHPLRWALAAGIGGLATVVIAQISGQTDSAIAFFLAGVFFLIAGVSLFAGRLQPENRTKALDTPLTLTALARRNLSRHRGRNLLSVCLVACACFVLATVGVNRRHAAQGPDRVPGPTGGFDIWATTEIPLHLNLSLAGDRTELGLSSDLSRQLGDATILQFRFLPGEDASCLNLQQPERPHLLGVPQVQALAGRFVFQELIQDAPENPWSLLDADLGEDVVPAIADDESARWIMHLKLGDDLDMVDGRGRPIKLRLVGLLKKSMLQSEMLISQHQFLIHFPDQSGTAYFLIDAPDDQTQTLAISLERELSAYGWDSGFTQDKIWQYKAVVNTYLAVFQMLGGLGLLLGSLGLGVVTYRNLLERRKELGCLRALGFASRTIFAILIVESAIVIGAGVAIGCAAALISAIPHLSAAGFAPPMVSFAALLVLMIACGMGTGLVSIRWALRRPLLDELKHE